MNTTIAPPARLLLATDLSPRCDRAMDRAVQLAGEWQAELMALNVLEANTDPELVLQWYAGKDEEQLLQIARRQLARDLAGLDIDVAVRIVRSSDASAAIRDAAASANSDMVITGVARNETFGRFLLGSTVARLARLLPQPLLVVRNRAHVAYQRIVVATDFSEPSRHALLAAARFFPNRELILYHAEELPLAGVSSHRSHAAPAGANACAEFLAACRLPADVRVRSVIEAGALASTLTQYVRRHEVELVVMGAHGRGAVMGALLGSSAARLLDWLPCDALLVREPLTDGR